MEDHYGYEKGEHSDYLEDTESRGFVNKLREKRRIKDHCKFVA